MLTTLKIIYEIRYKNVFIVPFIKCLTFQLYPFTPKSQIQKYVSNRHKGKA